MCPRTFLLKSSLRGEHTGKCACMQSSIYLSIRGVLSYRDLSHRTQSHRDQAINFTLEFIYPSRLLSISSRHASYPISLSIHPCISPRSLLHFTSSSFLRLPQSTSPLHDTETSKAGFPVFQVPTAPDQGPVIKVKRVRPTRVLKIGRPEIDLDPSFTR